MRMNKTAFLALLTSALLATSAYADSDGKRGPCDRQFDGPGFGMPHPAMMTWPDQLRGQAGFAPSAGF